MSYSVVIRRVKVSGNIFVYFFFREYLRGPHLYWGVRQGCTFDKPGEEEGRIYFAKTTFMAMASKVEIIKAETSLDQLSEQC